MKKVKSSVSPSKPQLIQGCWLVKPRALRVVFKLVGVNAANSFATLLYNVTNIFVAPFASLTGAPAAGNSVFEFSSIIAMIVYLLIAWALERIVYVLFYRPRGSEPGKRWLPTHPCSNLWVE
jgi:hypothetical protein